MSEIQMVMAAGALFAVPSVVAVKLTGKHVLGPFQVLGAVAAGFWFGFQIWTAREGQPLLWRLGFALAGVPFAFVGFVVPYWGAMKIFGLVGRPLPPP